MKLEQQVCSLELAKQLKELEFEQESLFYWTLLPSYISRKDEWIIEYKQEHGDTISAYTVAELGEMLPIKSSTNRNFPKAWVCEVKGLDYYETGDTEANARSKMLIYLKGNKLID